MYLMDQIIHFAHRAKSHGMQDHPMTKIFSLIEKELEGCPRFLFDENAIHTAVELTLGRPKVLREAMEHCRIPYPRMWVEWPEIGRQKLRETLVIDAKEYDNRPLPKRIGFLLITDEDGRKGTATWAWNNTFMTDNDPPNICPISPYFDLDKDHEQGPVVSSFLDANLAHLWKDNKIQLDALMSIWRTSHHSASIWGNKYLNSAGYNNGPSSEEQIANFYADVYGEYIMIWSIMMLLTSSRKIIDYTQIDMSKLNKNRVKRGELHKLDHTVVTIHINEEMKIHQKGQPLGYTRKSPRIHMVGSYLNRRGNKHWIVQPFWRGSGEMISRHVHVKP